MGVVYKAQDVKLDRHVALKFLPPHLSASEQQKARFIQEAKAASALNHPNVCTIFGIEEHEGQEFIEMEYVDGVTLREKIQKAPLKTNDAISYAIQIGEALQEAHSKGVVHRDIKADNIMVNAKNQVKVMDFGLAKLKGSLKLSRSASTVGTLAYMSPEQIQGGEVDTRADIFSFGVLLFEMLTGRLPFRGEHEAAMMYSIVNEEPESVLKHLPDAPMELLHILNRSLEKDPDDRYQSVSEMVIDLRRLRKDTTRVSRRSLPEAGIPVSPEEIPEATTKDVISKTPEREQKAISAVTPPAPTESRQRRKQYLVPIVVGLSLLALVVAYGVLSGLFIAEQAEAPRLDRKMLVVLPFENVGAPEDEYFADGITEEITSRLAALHGLGVISRTSAIQYKNTNKSIKEIGEELGVDYVLEGTVRWQRGTEGKGRVRVTPQLIRVSDDTHIWTEQHDRKIDEIFEVQAEIAEAVVKQLDLQVLEPERRAIWEHPTENLEAYDYFLQAREHERRGNATADNREYEQEVRMLRKAIDLDPDFALAYVNLCHTHRWLYFNGYDRSDERLAKSKAAVDEALRIHPNLPQAHEALAWYYYQGFLDYDRALKTFENVRKVRPNANPDLLSYIQRRQGKWEQSLVTLEEAFTLNPRVANLPFQLGLSYSMMRRYEEAETWYDRALSIDPEFDVARIAKAFGYILFKGNTQRARAIMESLPKTVDADYEWLFLNIVERNYHEALNRLAVTSKDAFEGQRHYVPKHFAIATLYYFMNESKLMKASADSADLHLKSELQKHPDDPRRLAALGLAFAFLGRNDDAIQAGKRAVELYPVSKDALGGTDYVLNLAEIYAVVDEHDAAIDQLDYLLSIPSYVSVSLLKLDPFWDGLRDHPRFQKLIAENK